MGVPTPRNLEGTLRDLREEVTLLKRTLARRGGGGTSGPARAAAGIIAPYAGVTSPEGWLLCDGRAVLRVELPELFAAIGTAYGAGDGSTTFNLPDLRGRVATGLDVAQAEFDALGEQGGAKTHKLTVGEMPAHDHDFNGQTFSWGPSGTVHVPINAVAGAGSSNNLHTVQDVNGWADTFHTGGDQPHNNLQPYVVTNYVISTGRASTPLPPAAPAPPLPLPLIDYTSDAVDQITAAAATWQPAVGADLLSFGALDRPLAVRAVFSAQASTTAGQAYVMIGVGMIGAGAVAPEVDQSTGVTRYGLTPFSNVGTSTNLLGEKRLILPVGTTSMQLWQRRNITTGAVGVSYGRLEIIPERWM